jgi:hypothetical protein
MGSEIENAGISFFISFFYPIRILLIGDRIVYLCFLSKWNKIPKSGIYTLYPNDNVAVALGRLLLLPACCCAKSWEKIAPEKKVAVPESINFYWKV